MWKGLGHASNNPGHRDYDDQTETESEEEGRDRLCSILRICPMTYEHRERVIVVRVNLVVHMLALRP